MNRWTELSIEYASQRNYLDDLYKVYPIIPEGIRDINKDSWDAVEKAFQNRNNTELIKRLLDLELFPIKDSYVAYLKRDPSSIARNPATVNRLCGRLYDIGINALFDKCSEPKETNRQMGQKFKEWLSKKTLGVDLLPYDEFLESKGNALLDASDNGSKNFAKEHLSYTREKGLDFVARFNGRYVIGEAKFLTDFGSHQDAQFADGISTLKAKRVKAIKIAIMDGVLYIQGDNKMHRFLKKNKEGYNIMSALVLREFLYQL
ncbi:restriction endonuclease [candidate division TA06 bacterium]|uniref:Restriction endonuclease n=1 Tax=candidate division TA06 bacterium TaxID=2250710 RepID=A0A933MKQ8_UNCT6|nr:restriction endonuclease [candidate division TA06 bacterium]